GPLVGLGQPTSGPLVATIWTRDGREWLLAEGLSAAEMRQKNLAHRQQGYEPVDVAGYLPGTRARYAALWVKPPAQAAPAHLDIHLEAAQLAQQGAARAQQGYRRAVLSRLVDGKGQVRWSAVWIKAGTQQPEPAKEYAGLEPDYAG